MNTIAPEGQYNSAGLALNTGLGPAVSAAQAQQPARKQAGEAPRDSSHDLSLSDQEDYTTTRDQDRDGN